MSIATLSEKSKSSRLVDAPLQRPADWPALPTVTSSDKKFVALHAVFDHDSNFASVFCTVSGGASTYQVDWGDGTVDTVGSSVQKDHNYNFASAGLSGTTSEGFKAATVTVTGAGVAVLTSVQLDRKTLTAGVVSNYSTGWLDIRAAGLVSMIVSSGGMLVNHRNLRQFEWIGPYAATSGANLFQTCNALENLIVPFAFTSSMTLMTQMFSQCFSLKSVPLLDTALVTSAANMFDNCRSLRTVPAFNFAALITVGSMFNVCSSLESLVVDFSHVSAASFTQVINACSKLENLVMDFHGATNLTNAFATCSRLRKFPDLNIGTNCTTITQAFQSCISLLVAPPVTGVMNVTSVSATFGNCSSLQIVPGSWNLANVSTGQAGSMSGCVSLSKYDARGVKFGFALSNPNKFTAAELNRIYTNLGAASGGAQTLTITGAPAASIAADDPTIATAKGWTVAGT